MLQVKEINRLPSKSRESTYCTCCVLYFHWNRVTSPLKLGDSGLRVISLSFLDCHIPQGWKSTASVIGAQLKRCVCLYKRELPACCSLLEWLGSTLRHCYFTGVKSPCEEGNISDCARGILFCLLQDKRVWCYMRLRRKSYHQLTCSMMTAHNRS